VLINIARRCSEEAMDESISHRDRVTAEADPEHLRGAHKYALVSYIGPHSCGTTEEKDTCNVTAFKIRGAFVTLQEADEAALLLQEQMSDADIFTVEMYQWTALKYCGGSLPAHYDSPTMQNIMEEENKKRASDIEKRLQDRSEFFDVIDHKTRNKHLEKQNKELQDEIDEMRALTKPCETNDVLAPASVST
jgi:hypothetical protein